MHPFRSPVKVVQLCYLSQAHLSCEDFRSFLGGSNFLGGEWNVLQIRVSSDGSAQNPSESAMRTLNPGEREERMVGIVLALDLEIHIALPFLELRGIVVEIQTQVGECQHDTTPVKRSLDLAATTSLTAWEF
jgi:hypothetical protein